MGVTPDNIGELLAEFAEAAGARQILEQRPEGTINAEEWAKYRGISVDTASNQLKRMWASGKAERYLVRGGSNKPVLHYKLKQG